VKKVDSKTGEVSRIKEIAEAQKAQTKWDVIEGRKVAGKGGKIRTKRQFLKALNI